MRGATQERGGTGSFGSLRRLLPVHTTDDCRSAVATPLSPSRDIADGERPRAVTSAAAADLTAAMTAGAIVAVFARLRRFAPDQLVEIALLTTRGLFLVDKREIGFVEFLEECLPGDLFECRILGVGRIRELDADNTGIVLAMRLADRCRTPAARLRPFADFVMIGGEFRFGHS